MDNKLKEYEELKELLKLQQDILKNNIPNHLQDILNIIKVEEITIEDIKKCAILLINQRKEIVNKIHLNLFIKYINDIKKSNLLLNNKIIAGLELFLLEEIKKEIKTETYFLNKEYDTFLIYYYCSHSILKYEEIDIIYLNELPIFNPLIKDIEEFLPVDIKKVVKYIFPNYFIIPFNQKDFIEYILIQDFYNFFNISIDNIYESELYNNIFKEDLLKGVHIKLEDLKINLFKLLKKKENIKKYKEIKNKFINLFIKKV